MDQTKKADVWAAEIWKKNVKSWERRKQDYNYREYLAGPALRQVLNWYRSVKDGIFLDLGCGDGNETREIRRILTKQGSTGKFFGFDSQLALIEIARRRTRQAKKIELVFKAGSLQELVEENELVGNVDRVFSAFLLQELSNAEKYFKLAADCLNKGGRGVFLFLHPAFGEAMHRKGAVRVNNNLVSSAWRWAAEFPIVEEGGKTFYVPYFHRKLEDYLKLARKYFAELDFMERRPTSDVVQKCEQDRESPFYDHLGNVYYPEIVDIPSLLIFVVRK